MRAFAPEISSGHTARRASPRRPCPGAEWTLRPARVRVASVLVVAEHGELEGVRAQALALVVVIFVGGGVVWRSESEVHPPDGLLQIDHLDLAEIVEGVTGADGYLGGGVRLVEFVIGVDGHLADAHLFLKLDVHEVGLRAV